MCSFVAVVCPFQSLCTNSDNFAGSAISINEIFLLCFLCLLVLFVFHILLFRILVIILSVTIIPLSPLSHPLPLLFLSLLSCISGASGAACGQSLVSYLHFPLFFQIHLFRISIISASFVSSPTPLLFFLCLFSCFFFPVLPSSFLFFLVLVLIDEEIA